ncbi:MAG: hypothetical protein KDA57_23530, partial [Planctomycetales bacterium]|nr:hypothetical protein [Planctomycetales bacterium]
YSAAVFGEHELRGSGIVPFVGGNLGMHFTYIRFNEVVAGFDSQGDHGFGYALVCGVRHQLGRRLAVEVRGQLENTPKLTSGSFYSIGAGLSMWF